MDIISREAWGARPPRYRSQITVPTLQLWLHHTAGNETGNAGVRAIQRDHMDGNGWADIAYSFVVDRFTLEVFEGRSAGVRGAHTAGHNGVSHGVAVMGNFEYHPVTDGLIGRLAELLNHGYAEGWWPAQFTGGHRDTKATACPGDNLYAVIPDINARARASKGGPIVATIEVPDPHTVEAQEFLRANGFDPGISDGIPGPKFLAAIKELGIKLAAGDGALVMANERNDELTEMLARARAANIETQISLDDAELGAASRAAIEATEAVADIYERQSRVE